MKRSYIVITFIVIVLSSCAVKKVVPEPSVSVVALSDTVRLTQGSLIYSLPQTVFEIDITLVRTIEKPGPYAAFASDLIGLSDVIRHESEEWTLKSVSLIPRDEIDPSEYYVVKSNAMIRAGAFVMQKQGLILDISSNSMINREISYNDGDADFAALGFRDLGSTQYFAVQRDTAYRLVDADTTFIRIPYLVERRRQLTQEQLAERAARTLLEIREGRHMILTGETNVFPQHNAPIDELNRLEKEYLSLFTGKVMSDEVKMKIYFTPESGRMQEEAVLFRLSEAWGVTEAGDESGKPVTINLTAAGKTKPLVLAADLQSMTSAPEGGLVYRIPEVVELTIREGDRSVLRTRAVVHQYGQKVMLPESFLLY
jgi:hypothetical protein